MAESLLLFTFFFFFLLRQDAQICSQLARMPPKRERMPLIINSPKSIFHLCGGLRAQHPSFIFVVDVGYKQCATPMQNVVIGRMHSATTRKLKAQVSKTLNKKVHRPVVAIANRQDRPH